MKHIFLLFFLIFPFTNIRLYSQIGVGSQIPFNGAAFAQSMNSYKAEVDAEKDTLSILIDSIKNFLPRCYDLKLDMNAPEVGINNDVYYLPVKVTLTPNKNALKLNETLKRTLYRVAIPKSERTKLDEHKIEYSVCTYNFNKITDDNVTNNVVNLYFRSNDFLDKFNSDLVLYAVAQRYNFVIIDNLGNKSYIDINPCYDDRIREYHPLKGAGLFSNGLVKLDLEDKNRETPATDIFEYTITNWFKLYGDIMIIDFNQLDEVKFELKIPKQDIVKYNNFNIYKE